MNTTMISAEELNLLVGQFGLLRAGRGLTSSPEDIRCISNSIQYGHYSFLRNSDDEIIAYIIWAKINKETYAEMKHYGRLPKYDYEWSEGPLTLVIDAVVKKGWENFSPAFFLAEARNQKFLCYLDKATKALKKVGVRRVSHSCG